MMTLPILIFLFVGALSNPAFGFHIVIDPGHGGIDTGAFHHNIRESDIVLDVALRLKELLQKDQRIQVSLTRTTDSSVPLKNRTQMADELNADLLVSLHANAAPDPRAKGVELFFQNSLAPDEEALYLANVENQEASEELFSEMPDGEGRGDLNAIIHDLTRQHRLKSSLRASLVMANTWKLNTKGIGPSIKQAPFHMVSESKIPSILVELGFLTNKKESQKLASSKYRQELAQVLRSSLLNFKDSVQYSIQNGTVSK